MVGRAPQRRIMSQKTKPEKRKAYRKKESRLGTTELINLSIDIILFTFISQSYSSPLGTYLQFSVQFF